MKPQEAWEAAVGQLQTEMPKAAFDTWVRDAQLISYEEGEFTIGVFNAYARDWLESRLSSTLTRLLTGIMNASVGVHFIVWKEDAFDDASSDDASFDDASDVSSDDAGERQFKIRIAHQSIRDALTEPYKIVVIPGYFRRWVPFLGPTLAWIVVAFRQMMYLRTRHKVKPNMSFRTSPQQVAHWAGIARNTLWRNLKDHRLRWFIKQLDPDEHVYEFMATMPLTPGDADLLTNFLIKAGAQSDPIAAIQTALNTPVSQLLPYPPPPPEEAHLAMEPMPRSVQDVVIDACGHIKAADFKQAVELADQLAAYLMPPNNVIIVSHYFLLNWLKHLGAAPAWFIALLRDQCYISKDEVRNTVWIHGGDPEIAQMLGLNRPKTISEWLTPLEDSRFERPLRELSSSQKPTSQNVRTKRREIKRDLVKQFVERVDYLDQSSAAAWQFKVNLVEPLIPGDQAEYDRALALIEAFLATDHTDLLEEMIENAEASGGAFGTHQGAHGTSGGAFGTFSPEAEARLKQVAARLEQSEGAFGTDGGAKETDSGRVWNALSSLKILKAPMKNLLQHLNTLSPEENTATTAVREDSGTQTLVVGEVPDHWDLNSLLASSQLHPGTCKKLQEQGLDSWILVSHMLYAHSRVASGVNNPMAVVASALRSGPQKGAGGYYDVLAQQPPRVLATLIEQAYNFAIQYPSEYYHTWQSGNQAWDLAMAQTDPQKLLWLAIRLGIGKV